WETTFQLDEGPVGRRLNRYDEFGRLVRTFSTDGDGLERDLEVYSYNEDGRKTKLPSSKTREPAGQSTMSRVPNRRTAPRVSQRSLPSTMIANSPARGYSTMTLALWSYVSSYHEMMQAG